MVSDGDLPVDWREDFHPSHKVSSNLGRMAPLAVSSFGWLSHSRPAWLGNPHLNRGNFWNRIVDFLESFLIRSQY